MVKPYVTAYVSQEVKERLPELLSYYSAPSVSKLVEEALKYWIEQMDIESRGRIYQVK